jgi:CRISPR-associated exonuclease Cas4
MISKNYLGVSLLSEYFYCPRSFAYRLIDFKPDENENFYIVDGRLSHARLEEKSSSYDRIGRKESRDLFLASDELGISTKIDRVIWNTDCAEIIEEKRGKRCENSQHDWQVWLEAYCFESNFNIPVSKCSIYYQASRRKRDIQYNDLVKNKILNFIKDIKIKIELMDIHEFEPVYDQRCFGCMFNDQCGLK